MAWNEPGGNKPNDPWGNNDQGPPDLDEAFRKFKEKFSGGGKGGDNKGSGGGDLPEFSGKFVAIIIAIIAVLYVAIGFYTVDEQEQAVVLRFGKYYETKPAGLHFNWPIIDQVEKLNITRNRSLRIQGVMLTEDENMVDIRISAQYTIKDAKNFILEVRSPERSLHHATESALRHVVGSASLHQVLTEGRAAVAAEIKERVQRYVDNYKTGILVTQVNIEDAQPPKAVQQAFDDVIRAKEDEQRAKNEAESYRNGIIPEARGIAQRQIEEARAYKEQVITKAEGETKRFSALRAEYEKAPRVTRERLYIAAMEQVLSDSSKVVVDVDSGNIMYLPLDKLMGQSSAKMPVVTAPKFINSTAKNQRQSDNSRAAQRSTTREGR